MIQKQTWKARFPCLAHYTTMQSVPLTLLYWQCIKMLVENFARATCKDV